MESFCDVQSVGTWMAFVVQPGAFLESGSLNHKRISLPKSDGITRPGGIRVFRKCPAIDEYLAIALNGFKKNDDEFWRRDDLERVRRIIRSRYSAGNAVAMRIVFTLRRTPLVVHVLGPRKHHQLAGFQVFRNIQQVAGRWWTLPESRNIGFAVRSFGRCCIQIRLPIRSPRYSRSSMVVPLCETRKSRQQQRCCRESYQGCKILHICFSVRYGIRSPAPN